MRIQLDQKNDALYLRLDEAAIMDSEGVRPGVMLDYNENGNVVGIEILGLSERVEPQNLTSVQPEKVIR